MSQGKSGFEIRADLLSQAQALIESNIQREYDAVYLHNDNHPDNKKGFPERQVIVGDVIQVAKQFNEFVKEQE